MDDCILEMRHICKHFGGVKALDDVSFSVKRGEIHGLVGENGAGKSTLMKVLSGVYPTGEYTGQMLVDGREQHYSCIKDSERSGVAIIYQELGLVKTMQVCENIFLGNEIQKGKGVIDWDQEYKRCRELLASVKLDVSPTTLVESLGTGKQQLIEIAKALNKNVKLLILDEPTASLTEADTQNLLKLLHHLKEQGMTCVFISHRLGEVMEIADTITVMRDGKTIVTRSVEEMSEEQMIAYMVGREMKQLFPKVPHTAGETVLEVREWTVDDPDNPGKFLVDHAAIDVRRGEIVGIAGLMGAGRTELAMSIFGGMRADGGRLRLAGKEHHPFKHPKQALHAGIGYLSEDRKAYGLVLGMDIRTNMTLSSLDKISRRGVINKDAELKTVTGGIESLRIKTPTMYQLVQNLSGGNQQKVLLMKSMLANPKVLFLDEPTRGIDVGAKYEIYQLMNKLVEEGVCIVMISSELPEIINMSDRIYVMCEGRIQTELVEGRDKITQENILYYASGGTVRESGSDK